MFMHRRLVFLLESREMGQAVRLTGYPSSRRSFRAHEQTAKALDAGAPRYAIPELPKRLALCYDTQPATFLPPLLLR